MIEKQIQHVATRISSVHGGVVGGEEKKKREKKRRDVVFVVSVGCMQNKEGRSAGTGAASCRHERGEMSRCLSLIRTCRTEHTD